MATKTFYFQFGESTASISITGAKDVADLIGVVLTSLAVNVRNII